MKHEEDAWTLDKVDSASGTSKVEVKLSFSEMLGWSIWLGSPKKPLEKWKKSTINPVVRLFDHFFESNP